MFSFSSFNGKKLVELLTYNEVCMWKGEREKEGHTPEKNRQVARSNFLGIMSIT